MIAEFAQYIRNIAVFLIFTAFANMMMPQAKYKQYVSLALGFVMIFLILTPVRAFFNNSDSIPAMIDRFTNRIQTEIAPSADSAVGETQTTLILSTYEQHINSQIQSLTDEGSDAYAYVSSSITADTSDERFGEITAIDLTVREKTASAFDSAAGGKEAARPFIRIEPVNIDADNIFSSVLVMLICILSGDKL